MHEYLRMFRVPIALFGIAFLLGIVFLVSFFPQHAVSQTSGNAITGWAWSDNIGWISFNCSNTGTCGASNYGFSIADDGTVSGYAWSDNIGWVSAQSGDVSGCPTAPCTPKISPSTGAISGWLRSLAGVGAPGGWDGWISLSGSGYGPVLSATSSVFSGYAWGSDVVGWVSFSYASTTYQACIPNSNTCVSSTTIRHFNADCTYADSVCQYASYGYGCSANACLVPPSPGAGSVPGGIIATPKLVRPGNTVQVQWDVVNADPASCTVTGSNGDSWSGLASATRTSSPITMQTTYRLHCNGSAVSILTYDAQVTVNIVPTFQEK